MISDDPFTNLARVCQFLGCTRRLPLRIAAASDQETDSAVAIAEIVQKPSDSVEKVSSRRDFSGLTRRCCATWALRRNADDPQPPIAEPRALACELAQPGTQGGLVPIPPPIRPTPSLHPDEPTGVSLAESDFFPHDTPRFSLRLRAYHFFVSTTFSASMSSACCATIFFNRLFSSSS